MALGEQADIDDKTPAKFTTADLELFVRQKYPRDRWALFYNVPDVVSLQQRRRIDALACGLWQSNRRDIVGMEFKASRGDWLREVRQVDKADPFVAVCDQFWLVTTDAKIAKLEELPACWGWMSATRAGLRVQRPATRLPGCGDTVPRDFMLGVLRKMQDDLVNSPDVRAVIEQRDTDREEIIKNRVAGAVRLAEDQLKRLEESQKRFEEASGIAMDRWDMGRCGEVVKQLRQLGYPGGPSMVPDLLEAQHNALRIALDNLTKVRESLAAKTPTEGST